jgi:hypothetical protein
MSEMDRGHIKLYVPPDTEPEPEPEPTPQELAAAQQAKELREHAELVRRIQEERAAKLADPNNEGQD